MNNELVCTLWALHKHSEKRFSALFQLNDMFLITYDSDSKEFYIPEGTQGHNWQCWNEKTEINEALKIQNRFFKNHNAQNVASAAELNKRVKEIELFMQTPSHEFSENPRDIF